VEEHDHHLHKENDQPDVPRSHELGDNDHEDNEGADEEEVEEVEEGVQEASSVQALDDHEVVGRVFAKFLDVHDSFVNCEEEKGGHECEEECTYGDCYFVL